jgi:glycosyltransferase involved in cell wall biosynthesis
MARSKPTAADLERGDKRVTILLVSAWGMGGTIRAALNQAGYLAARGYEVEILSVFRRREESFFGAFPPGVKVTALDDQRAGHLPTGLKGRLRAMLLQRDTVFMHRVDRSYGEWNLWVDLQLARRLRGRTGFLIGTRPGLNYIAAEVCPPGMVSIGLEQMHLEHHHDSLKKAMKRHYPDLDRLVVLTDRDRGSYDRLLKGRARLAVIPNTAREMEGPKADLARPVVLAAGRLTAQKGFDFLVPAYAQIAEKHPEWRLRLCGRGHLEKELRALIAEKDPGGHIGLEGPADMAEAMGSASIFVLSSRFEGFPLILLEAMGKGMAVIAYDCPTGPSDIIDDHRNGLLVPPRDIDALAAAIDEMIGDEDLRRRCAAAAMETAREFTIEAVGPRWVSLLDELWAQRAQGAGVAAGA